MLLAIETSCDETAVAVFDLAPFCNGGYVSGQVTSEDYLKADLISSQAKLHEPYGGVVPELAAREHTRNLPLLVQEALKKAGISLEHLSAIAVTQGPGLKGCLLVGLSFAKALSMTRELPLFLLNHLEGHLFAGELLDITARPKLPAIALLVSGGHTLLVYVESFRNYRIIAETRDDAAGEAFDKSATILRLPYPGGPQLSKAAMSGDPTRYSFPIAMPRDMESFSFSGLKTAVVQTVSKLDEHERSDTSTVQHLAASIEEAIVESLVKKSVHHCQQYHPASFLLTGGVAANRRLRERLTEETVKLGIQFAVPPPRWCTDNAAMLGILAARMIEADPTLLNKGVDSAGRVVFDPLLYSATALPRWPIGEFSQAA